MLKKVVYVALLVSDQDKALDFYTNVIGLEKRGDYPTPDGPRFLTVGVKGQDFELVLWPGTPGRAKLGAAVYTIAVENCRMAFAALKERRSSHSSILAGRTYRDRVGWTSTRGLPNVSRSTGPVCGRWPTGWWGRSRRRMRRCRTRGCASVAWAQARSTTSAARIPLV